MSVYKRVVLTEKDNSVTQSVDSENVSAVDRQVNNFDNNYTDQKLNDLYKEFDSITLNETELLNQAVEPEAKQNMSAVAKVRLATAIIIAAMLIFLAIYNIFVINGLKNNINVISSEITTSESELNSAMQQYAAITDDTNIAAELEAAGYTDMDEMVKVHISVPQNNYVDNTQITTNWWDALCNFIANIFGR